MVIHNYIGKHSNDDVNFIYCNQDSNFVSTIPNRYNKYIVSSHASASDDSIFKASFFIMDAFGDRVASHSLDGVEYILILFDGYLFRIEEARE
jgi:hypothetical protein